MVRFALKNSKKSALALIGVAALSLTMAAPAFAEDDTTDVNVTAGDLSITNVVADNFDDGNVDAGVKLTGSNFNVTADLDFTVTDATGSGEGYTVTAKATQFSTGGGTPVLLPLNGLTLSGVVAVQTGGTGVDAPDATDSTSALDNHATTPVGVNILEAGAGEGMASFNVTDATLTLAIPADTEIGTYSSTLTIDVSPIV